MESESELKLLAVSNRVPNNRGDWCVAWLLLLDGRELRLAVTALVLPLP